MTRRCRKRPWSLVRLAVLFAGAMLVIVPAREVEAGILDSRGDTSFFSGEVRPLADFPALESVVPMPLNINPFNRRRVRQSCTVQVVRRNAPLKSARGEYVSHLVLMDHRAGTFKSIELSAGKLKTDPGGEARLEFDIATDLFAEGFKSGNVSAWSHTRLEFIKRKGSFAFLRCAVTAKK